MCRCPYLVTAFRPTLRENIRTGGVRTFVCTHNVAPIPSLVHWNVCIQWDDYSAARKVVVLTVVVVSGWCLRDEKSKRMGARNK